MNCTHCQHLLSDNEPALGYSFGEGRVMACKPCAGAWEVLNRFAQSIGGAVLAVLEDNGLGDKATELASLRDWVNQKQYPGRRVRVPAREEDLDIPTFLRKRNLPQ